MTCSLKIMDDVNVVFDDDDETNILNKSISHIPFAGHYLTSVIRRFLANMIIKIGPTSGMNLPERKKLC